VACALVLAGTFAQATPDDQGAIAAAITQLEHSPADPDRLLAAARACEDKLDDPARALVLYERIVREAPDARAAVTASKRAAVLRGELGEHDEYATQASALAHLIADGEHLSQAELVARADALAAQRWPGAPEAELFVAEWMRARGQFSAAQARYAHVQAHWPGSPQAIDAARSAAGCAIDAHDWSLAERLARDLPAGDPLAAAARSEVLHMATRGRSRDRITTFAWAALALVFVALLASLGEAVRRGGWRWPRARPPVEVMFLAPIAAALLAIAFAAQRAIAPAIAWISAIGLGLAYLSGMTLDLLQLRGRAYRARSIIHVAACVVGVLAIAYIAITRDGLLDLLATTLRDGPES
jgi:hypothetical protein